MHSIFHLCLVLLLLAPAAHALDANPTTRLITARPGEWIRRYAPNGHTHTELVAANAGGETTLHLLRHHDGHVVESKAVRLSHDYLRGNAPDPDAPDARTETLTHRGVEYTAKAIDVRLEESPGRVYISDAVPASGVLRIDIVHPSGSATSLWTDEFGSEPDELLERAPPLG